MALSLGTLFVKLNADPSQLTKGMNEAADKVAKFGNKLNEISGKLGAVGVSLTAIGAGAIRLASQFDSQVKTATDELGNSFNAVSVEIARALLPTIQSLSQMLAMVANYFRSLSPETKQLVAGFAATTAAALTLTAGVGKVVSAFTALAPVITGALTPVSGVLLPIIAVIAALVAIVPLLWYAWKNNFGNIQGYTGAVVDWIQEKWRGFTEYFSGAIEFIGNAWTVLTDYLWKSWASAMKTVAGWAAKVAKVFGADWTYELEAFEETIDDIANRGFKGLVEDAVDGGKAIKLAWTEAATDMGNAIKEKIGAAFDFVSEKYGQTVAPMSKLGGAAGQQKQAGKPMTFEAIDVVGKMPDKLQSATDGFAKGIEAGAQNVLSAFGSLNQVVMMAQQGFAAGGPWGALAGAVLGVLMQSEQFTQLVEEVGGFVGDVANQLAQILGPAFAVLGSVLKAITPIIQTIMKIMGGPLFFALKALGLAVLGIVWVVGQIWNFFTEVIAWIFNTIGDALNMIWGGLGQGMKDTAAAMRAGMVDIAGVEQSMRDIRDMTMDTGGNLDAKGTKPIEVLGAAAGETASTLNDLNASLTNIPAGFKIAAARFNATAPSIYDFGLGGNMQEVEVNLNLDGKQIHKAIIIANARGQYIHRGGPMPSKWWGA